MNYVLNGEILADKAVPEVARTLRGETAKGFDDYVSKDSGDRETVLRNHERNNLEHMDADREELFEAFNLNLEEHVINAVEAYPEVEFYFFFPALQYLLVG